jgi:hypothetical protein
VVVTRRCHPGWHSVLRRAIDADGGAHAGPGEALAADELVMPVASEADAASWPGTPGAGRSVVSVPQRVAEADAAAQSQ